MQLTYSLDLNDYLAYQLFTASQSARIQRQLRRTHWGLALASAALAVLFYFQPNVAMSIYFGAVAGVVAVFYPRYFKWRHRRHYIKHIQEHYKARVGESIQLRIQGDAIETQTAAANSHIQLSEVVQANDLPAHCLIQLQSGQSLILPKRDITDLPAFFRTLADVGIERVDHTQWKW